MIKIRIVCFNFHHRVCTVEVVIRHYVIVLSSRSVLTFVLPVSLALLPLFFSCYGIIILLIPMQWRILVRSPILNFHIHYLSPEFGYLFVIFHLN